MTPRTSLRPTRLLALLAIAGLLASACGGDDTPGANETTPAEPTGGASEPAGSEPAGETVEITAVDYEFEGVPATIAAGTQLTLTNTSTAELHELVAFKVPEGEDRPVAELAVLPEEELDALFGQGPPATVLLAPPGGGDTIQAVGDGTLSEAGRYVFVCFIPEGADPQEYLAGAGGTAPPTAAGGPPHFALGMYAETIVE